MLILKANIELLLSEGRTVVKCICECNQSGRRVVFYPEPVTMSVTFCGSSAFCSVSVFEGDSLGASQNSSQKLWQFPPEQQVVHANSGW